MGVGRDGEGWCRQFWGVVSLDCFWGMDFMEGVAIWCVCYFCWELGVGLVEEEV